MRKTSTIRSHAKRAFSLLLRHDGKAVFQITWAEKIWNWAMPLQKCPRWRPHQKKRKHAKYSCENPKIQINPNKIHLRWPSSPFHQKAKILTSLFLKPNATELAQRWVKVYVAGLHIQTPTVWKVYRPRGTRETHTTDTWNSSAT